MSGRFYHALNGICLPDTFAGVPQSVYDVVVLILNNRKHFVGEFVAFVAVAAQFVNQVLAARMNNNIERLQE